MAIAFDATSTSTDTTASPTQWNHTCTGSNGLLIVAIHTGGIASAPVVSAVTYNAVSMTKVGTIDDSSSDFYETTVWLLHAPTTGSNQISVTWSGGSSPHVGGMADSYTGAQQVDSADATASATGSASGDLTASLTTIANNCWIFAAGHCAGSSPTMAADQTSRGSLTIAPSINSLFRIEDTNFAIKPLGQLRTMGMTAGGSLVQTTGIVLVSFAPASITDPIQVNKLRPRAFSPGIAR